MGWQPAPMKARRFRTLLHRRLGYEVVRQTGSHKQLEAPGRPRLTLAFKDGDDIPSGLIRRILVRDVGLSIDEAREVIEGD